MTEKFYDGDNSSDYSLHYYEPALDSCAAAIIIRTSVALVMVVQSTTSGSLVPSGLIKYGLG